MSPMSAPEESDRSEDEFEEGPSNNAATQQSKRSQRACDRCRKSKSKCQPGPDGPTRCRACAAANIDCTFSGPSFRRGPPKGYIKALEHRLHQMESTLAAIMTSKDPRAQGVIADLRRDSMARDILEGVDTGPFGPTGRVKRSVDPTQDNFFASIVSAAPPKQASERSRRQSRMSRESVTKKDPSVLERPTLEWQDRLSEALALWAANPDPPEYPRGRRRDPHMSSTELPAISESSLEPARQRRRLDTTALAPDTTWNDLHEASDTDRDELEDCADAFGNLSIDENKEVRYHDNTCGLYILASDKRWNRRNLGGIWNFPMSHFWPGIVSAPAEYLSRDGRPTLPPLDVQEHLINTYFTYVNPWLPVIDQEDFVEQFRASQIYGHETSASDVDEATQTVRPERVQKITDLMLFSMFAFAAHYSNRDLRDHEARHIPDGRQLDMGAEYAASARAVLDTMYQSSRTSTCQALILLGIREFGVGYLEVGWLHVGMALRMAFDLGLNRDSAKWRNHGELLFTPAQTSVRRRIWWACCLADKYTAQFLGRPMAIHESDFATLHLDLPDDDGVQLWAPNHPSPSGQQISPVPANYINYSREISSLTILHGEVVDKIYPITRDPTVARRAAMDRIHSRLIQWSLNLPETLRYLAGPSQPCPPPHVLYMHCYYWSIMLLLHRPFIPKDISQSAVPGPSVNDHDTIPWKSLDVCQSAASHIAKFASLYHQRYDLKYGPPLMTTALQSAGLMHVMKLKFYPTDVQALTGLQDCIDACANLRACWPSATRVRDLLRGAGIQLNLRQEALVENPRKRPMPIVFQDDGINEPALHSHTQVGIWSSAAASTATQQHPLEAQAPISQVPFNMPIAPTPSYPLQNLATGLEDGLLADLLGPVTPGTDSAIAMMPAFDWWPTVPTADDLSLPQGQFQEPFNNGAFVMPTQSFTFDTNHYSPDFLRGIRDPILHFPSPSYLQ